MSQKINHIITANEGTALSIAAGYHLATNKIPLFIYKTQVLEI